MSGCVRKTALKLGLRVGGCAIEVGKVAAEVGGEMGEEACDWG